MFKTFPNGRQVPTLPTPLLLRLCPPPVLQKNKQIIKKKLKKNEVGKKKANIRQWTTPYFIN